MCAVHLLRGATGHDGPVSVHLVERRRQICEGAAFGTRDPVHLLNVRSSSMSALPTDPGHFVHWLHSTGRPADPAGFAPRMAFAEYLRHTLGAAESAADPRASLTRHEDEASSVAPALGGGWLVTLARGDVIHAGAVVLASGHQAPGDPLRDRWEGPRVRWIGDPWAPHALDQVAADEPVAIIGSGLTATDVILSLTTRHGQPRTAPIWVVSRHAWFPQPHLRAPHQPAQLQSDVDRLLAQPGLRTRSMVRWFRALLADAGRLDPAVDWRATVDGIRPHSARIWRAMDVQARAQFMRHVRPIWEVHRHRMAAQVADHVHAALAAGDVRLVSGRPSIARARDGGVDLHVSQSETSVQPGSQALRVAWVVNCTGPGPLHGASADPALASLIGGGSVCVDPLHLGIRTDAQGRALDAHGTPQGSLFAVGTLRRPDCWESTAVPELRVQAAEAAGLALAAIG